jgi:DNA-binding MarR family transcriptional regulator
MWIRLLGVTRSAENELREYLRLTHETTLPRFDVMAALYRRREGVTMSELSRMLLVSNGNATAVVDRLEARRLVRAPRPRPTAARSCGADAEGCKPLRRLASGP